MSWDAFQRSLPWITKKKAVIGTTKSANSIACNQSASISMEKRTHYITRGEILKTIHYRWICHLEDERHASYDHQLVFNGSDNGFPRSELSLFWNTTDFQYIVTAIWSPISHQSVFRQPARRESQWRWSRGKRQILEDWITMIDIEIQFTVDNIDRAQRSEHHLGAAESAKCHHEWSSLKNQMR